MEQLDIFNNPVPPVRTEVKIVRSYIRRKKVTVLDSPVVIDNSGIKTGSKINRERLIKQNLKALNLILAGGRVNMTHAYDVGIGTPHSRFADVRLWLSQHGVILQDAMTVITNLAGEKISCKEYWMSDSDIEKISKIVKSWDEK